MMEDYKMANVAFTLSKAAMELVKAGQATFSSGGVRLLNGQLYELAKPVVSNGLSSIVKNFLQGGGNPIAGIVNVASSLTQNVQSALIMKDIGVINTNIGGIGAQIGDIGAQIGGIGAQIGDISSTINGISSGMGVINNNITSLGTGINSIISQCSSISAALGGLQQIAALSWVGTAFSLANCGISIASFYATMNKLNGISKLIEEFYDQYRRDRDHDTSEKFYNYYLNLKTDIGSMRTLSESFVNDQSSLKNYSQSIEEHINGTASFIRKMRNEISGSVSKDKTIVKMIMSLYVMLAQTINEFCCLYYYSFRTPHHMLNDWNAFLLDISSEEFKGIYKEHLLFSDDYMEIGPEKKKQAYLVGTESISEMKTRFDTCKALIDKLPQDQYYHLDDIINRQLYLELQTQVPGLRNLDQTLTEDINNNVFFEDASSKEVVYLPAAY